MLREYKTTPSARLAGRKYYQSKRGPDYKSHEDRRTERATKAARKASDRLGKEVRLAAEVAFGVRECRSCGETLPLDSKHYAPQERALNGFGPRCRACISGHTSWSAREQKRANVITERELLASNEAASGKRECSACDEELPLDRTHFVPIPVSRNGLSVRCRACLGGYTSWSSRDAEKQERLATRRAEVEARATAKAEAKAIEAEERARVSTIKNSDEWKAAIKTRNKAFEMMPLYSELAATAWFAWDQDMTAEELGEALYEVASRFNRVEFLQRNSQGFVAAVDGNYEDTDPYEMARTWEELGRTWVDKCLRATETMERLLLPCD